jgi:hypothetical protein
LLKGTLGGTKCLIFQKFNKKSKVNPTYRKVIAFNTNLNTPRTINYLLNVLIRSNRSFTEERIRLPPSPTKLKLGENFFEYPVSIIIISGQFIQDSWHPPDHDIFKFLFSILFLGVMTNA